MSRSGATGLHGNSAVIRFFTAVAAALLFSVTWAGSARVTLELPSEYIDGTPIVEGDIKAVRVAYGAPGQPPFVRLLEPAQSDFDLSGIPTGEVEFSASVQTGDFDWSDYSAPQTVFFTAQAGLKSVLGFDLVPGGERMAITFVGARVGNSDPSNSVTVNAHPDIQAGDFVVIDCYHDANVITGAFLDNAAGLTLLFSHYGQTGTEREVATFYGFVGETPPASWTLSWDDTNGSAATSAVASVYRGVDTGNPFDVAFVLGSHLVDDANMHNPTSPAITTVTDGAFVHIAAAISQDDLTAAGAPTNYTLSGSMFYAASTSGTQPNLFDPGADDANLEVAYREIATAGTETPGAWQNTDNGTTAVSDTTAWTLALRPAAGGGGPEALTAQSGSFSLAGGNVGLMADRRMEAQSGAFAITGTDVELTVDAEKTLTALQGDFVYSGTDANLIADRIMVAESGAFSISGTDATLILNLGIDAQSGAFSISGEDADLLLDRLLIGQSGTFLFAGADANLSFGQSLQALVGSFSVAGADAGLLVDRLLQCVVGAFTLSGTNLNLTYSGVEAFPDIDGGVTVVSLTPGYGLTSLTPKYTIQ